MTKCFSLIFIPHFFQSMIGELEGTDPIEGWIKSLNELMETIKVEQSGDFSEESVQKMSHILSELENFMPAHACLGGAIKIVSVLFNPAKSLPLLSCDMKTFASKIQSCDDDKRQNHLLPTINEIKQLFLKVNLENNLIIRNDVKEMVSVLKYQTQFMKIDEEDMRIVLHNTYKLAIDMKFQKTVDEIECIYEATMDDSNPFDEKMEVLERKSARLRFWSRDYLNADVIKKYLKVVHEEDEKHGIQSKICEHVANYIVVVFTKYLQLIVTHFTLQNDIDNVIEELENFSKWYEKLLENYKNVSRGYIFRPGYSLADSLSLTPKMKELTRIERKASDKHSKCIEELELNQLDRHLCHFLEKTGLLTPDNVKIFVREEMTFDVLVDFSDGDLKTIGFKKLVMRKRILKAMKEYDPEGKTNFTANLQIRGI